MTHAAHAHDKYPSSVQSAGKVTVWLRLQRNLLVWHSEVGMLAGRGGNQKPANLAIRGSS